MRRLRLGLAIALAVCLIGRFAVAAPSGFAAASLPDFAFDQHPGAALPLGTMLRDETGRPVALGDFFGAGPVILAFEYFRCAGLCGLALDHLATTLGQIPLVPGGEYEVVAISIDPAETPADAAALKAGHLARGGFAEARSGIHFLVGDAAAVRSVADAVGFRYRYDAASGQFAHPAGIVIASPEGNVSRYLLGIDYPPLDLRLGLVDAALGKIAAPATHLLLLCYSYDPATGRYNLAVHRLLEGAAVLTMLALGLLILVAARSGRAGQRRRRAS